MEGELSIKENETLLVLANLGNGWLSARRQSPARGEEDENVTGLVPENYVQKIQ